jgi:hypothetical protein
MDFFDKYGKYAPLTGQILMTILVVNHWYRGLHYEPLVVIWIVLFGMSISPILDIFYGNSYED